MKSSRQLVQSVRRLASRRRSSDTTAAEAPARTVVSRRIWRAHELKMRHKEKPSSKKKTSSADDDKPWPQSVVYASYAAAVTVIPYVSVWFISSNPMLRSYLLPSDDESKIMNRIRQHFGEEDPDAVSYVDATIEPTLAKQYRLPDEPSAVERVVEAEIQHRQASEITAVVGIVDETSGSVRDEKQVQLPGWTLANRVTLAEVLSLNINAEAEAPAIAVHFLSTDDGSSDTTSQKRDGATLFSVEDTLASSEQTTSGKDPLIRKLQTYSSWQYQDPELSMQANNRQQTASSHSAIEKSRLDYEILQLETELRNGSSRPVDDILDELNHKKAELRKLTWRRWVPWS